MLCLSICNRPSMGKAPQPLWALDRYNPGVNVGIYICKYMYTLIYINGEGIVRRVGVRDEGGGVRFIYVIMI
jgi:hypothetical protein